MHVTRELQASRIGTSCSDPGAGYPYNRSMDGGSVGVGAKPMCSPLRSLERDNDVTGARCRGVDYPTWGLESMNWMESQTNGNGISAHR